MDTTAQLALAAKARKVFESDGTFLAFPALTPLGWQPALLDFTTITSADHMLAFAEICRLVNACPQDALFQPTADRYLWDAYQGVLSNAVLAQGDLSDDQRAALQQARAVLYVTDATGTPGPSPAVAAYDQYRAAWFAATQAYDAAKLSAAAATDPAAQTQWTGTDEPALRARVAGAEQDWETLGQKAAIDAARATEAACAAQAPALQWQNWATQFNPDIDMMTDAQTARFGITGFSPPDFWKQPTWPTLTLGQAEIAQLAAQAPDRLRNVLGASSAPTVASVSLDYCAVTLERPWFHAEVFDARFWRLPDGAPALSDGADPPGGSWPAYVAAVVFARNVRITPLPTPTPQPVVSPPHVFVPPPVIHPPPPVMHSVPVVHTLPVAHPPFVFHPMPPMLHAMAIPPHPAPTAPAPAVAHPAVSASAPLANVHAAVAFHPIIINRLMVAPIAAKAPAAPPTQAATPQPAPTADPTISVLAFICKRLGKCPDPDMSFDWGGTAAPGAATTPAAPPSAGTQPTPTPAAAQPAS